MKMKSGPGKQGEIVIRTLRGGPLAYQTTLFLVFLVVFILAVFLVPNFFTPENLLNVLRQAAPTMIVAAAMTLVITLAGIDLSVGSGLAVVAVLSAMALSAGWPVWLVLSAMLLLGVLIGSINGYFISYQGIPAFIVTLAALSILRGLALLLTQGYSIPIDPESPFLALGRGWVLGVPVPVVIAAVTVLAIHGLLEWTRFGVYIKGIGSNMEAVRRSGVNVRRIILLVYVLSGLAVAVSGVVTAARLASGSSYTGVGFELQAIAAVIIGGTSLFGGRGSVVGTILGTLFLAMIGNVLILRGISPFYEQIIGGTVILLAIWLNRRLSGSGSGRGRE
jgi:simple sugar transport system permease protein